VGTVFTFRLPVGETRSPAPGQLRHWVAKHATIEKHLFDWDWTVSKCLDTDVIFQTTVFLIPIVRNSKPEGHQALSAKPATAFPEFVYIIVILSYVSACNCSLNRLNL